MDTSFDSMEGMHDSEIYRFEKKIIVEVKKMTSWNYREQE